jgi:hypothetical protein
MNEAFKRILDDAVLRIEEADKKAREAAVQAKKDLRGIADFAETLPHRILDTMSVLATTEFNWSDQNPWHSYGGSGGNLEIGGQQGRLEGGLRMPLKGKYRAIVILQKMD